MKGCWKIKRKFKASSDEFRSAKRVQNIFKKWIKTSEVMENWTRHLTMLKTMKNSHSNTHIHTFRTNPSFWNRFVWTLGGLLGKGPREKRTHTFLTFKPRLAAQRTPPNTRPTPKFQHQTQRKYSICLRDWRLFFLYFCVSYSSVKNFGLPTIFGVILAEKMWMRVIETWERDERGREEFS